MLAPDDTSTGQVSITVTNAVGTSTAVTAVMQSVLPGLSVLANYVRGVGYPTAQSSTGRATSLPCMERVLALLSRLPRLGRVFTGAYQTVNPVEVRIGGMAAEVL